MSARGIGGWLTRIGGIAVVVTSSVLAMSPPGRGAAGEGGAPQDRDGATIALGAELFQREWLAGDERSPGGDGLGPVYNDTSCVACHNLGAPGGGGPANKNILILNGSPLIRMSQRATGSTTLTTTTVEAVAPKSLPAQPAFEIPDVLKGMFAFVQGENARLAKAAAAELGRHPAPPTKAVDLAEPSPATVREVTGAEAPRIEPPPTPTLIARSSADALAKVHPGFLTSSSVVLHRFGTDPGYARWRHELIGMGRMVQTSRGNPESLTREQMNEMSQLQAESRLPIGSRRMVRAGDVAVMTTERNTTALFGAGRIDAIAAGAIEDAAAERVAATQFPEIRGRVCRVADGRIGRFGWKGQLASLDDFVLNACAVELGLEVPDHAQSADPLAPEAKARGLDLTARECAALTAYVASLPAPVERAPAGPQEAARIAEGRSRFEAIGCATCHRPKLGDVAGIYSDLLVHDMGPSLADSGSYGVNSSESPGQVLPRVPVPLANAGRAGANPSRPIVGALRQEWRTPPLWGLRDSGPYLHDGRAATLEQAIALHGGEAQKTAQRFFGLDPQGRAELLVFLKSLVAPTQLAGR